MIVLCPKTFAGRPDASSIMDKELLKSYLTKYREKANVANDVWDSWRFDVNRIHGEEKGTQLIVLGRGSFRPELIRLNSDFTEEAPKAHTEQERIDATKDLVNRRWADIEYFITQEPQKYQNVNSNIEPITLEEFHLKIMVKDPDFVRSFLEQFAHSRSE